MAKIYPFPGIRYNPNKVKDPSRYVSPPYDVITLQGQERYYQRDPHNVVRLILGKEHPDDSPSNNKYTRSGDLFEGWLKEGILGEDEGPAIYIYAQDYELDGENYQRVGFICLVKLEDFGRKVVFPHEATFPKPKEDRLNLMRATRANLSPIFSLYEDEGRIIDGILRPYLNAKPLIELKDEDRVRHRLWAMTDEGRIDKMVGKMKTKPIFIADGHHRYETALTFRNEMRASVKGSGADRPWNRMMICLVSLEDKGLVILPVHRLVRALGRLDVNTLREKLVSNFYIKDTRTPTVFSQMKTERQKHAFGMYYKGKYYLLILKDEAMLDEISDPSKPKEWKTLDVTILSSLILGRCLGVSSSEENIGYTKDRTEAKAWVDKGEYELAFFLNPVSPGLVKQIAWAHQLMPPKSTYFYPKLLTGLVINKF